MKSSKILVVEDNSATRAMLRVTLESDGYTVIEAADGRAALAAVDEEMPALVLQDVFLPDMDGFELVRQLRVMGGAATPIIALSGFLHRVADAAACAEAGFSASLVKPIEPTRLLKVIRPYLPHPATPTGKGHRVLLVEDDLVQGELTRVHLTRLGFSVTAAASATEALRLARAHPPDIVLSNVLMPDLDGFQLCFALRSDPKLAGVPVILASAWHEAASHRELAAHVGASALVLKTPELNGVSEALLAALERGAPSIALEPALEARLAHSQAVVRQLQRQVSSSADLIRACTLRTAQISLLSGVADALARNVDAEAAVRDLLAAALDAAGISKGALYLYLHDGSLGLRHVLGFAPTERAGLLSFFGQVALLEECIQRRAPLSIPSPLFPGDTGSALLARMDAVSAQIVPLLSEQQGMGAILLCAKDTDVTSEDSIAFARAMGNQLEQSLALAKAFTQLTASERRYRAVTEGAPEAVWILSPEGAILEVNSSVESTLGLPRDRIVGRRIHDFIPAGHAALEFVQSLQTGVGGRGGTSPISLLRSDGSSLLMEFTSSAVDVGEERLIIVSIGRDVTDRMKTQAQQMFSDRMAAIGAIAAGVAHEINNPLTATVANLEFALDHAKSLSARFDHAEFSTLQEVLRDAAEGVDCVRTIVRDLKIFSRAEEDNRAPVNVESVLESSLRLARHEIRSRAQVVRHYGDIYCVEANESRLGQVFLNLLVNAAQALPEDHAATNQISIRTRMDASGRVVVEIEDNGPGISEEVLSHLFTPFFTTKPRSVGTGLGLSICRRIVTSFGGEIEVESVVARGTVFRVFLQPTGTRQVQKHGSTFPPAAVVPPRRGRLLIVDDDEMSAAAISRALSSDHQVSIAGSVDSALAFVARGDCFDVIICDLMMPVKTGVEFFDELSVHSPETAKHVIFLTGGAFTVKARQFLDRVPNPRLEKPFRIQALRALVSSQLASMTVSQAG